MRLAEAEAILRGKLKSTILHRSEVEEKLESARQSLLRVQVLISDLLQAEANAAGFERLKADISAFRRGKGERGGTALETGAAGESNAATAAALEEAKRYMAALERELAAAEQEAKAAAQAVHEAAGAVMQAEFENIAQRLVKAHQKAWRILDLVNGYVRLCKRRGGKGSLLEFLEQLSTQLNRRSAAIAAGSAELRAAAHWQAFIEERGAEAEQLWVEYAARLAEDADATFDLADKAQ